MHGLKPLGEQIGAHLNRSRKIAKNKMGFGNDKIKEGRGGLCDSEGMLGGWLMSGRWDSARSRMIHTEAGLKGQGGGSEEGCGWRTTGAGTMGSFSEERFREEGSWEDGAGVPGGGWRSSSSYLLGLDFPSSCAAPPPPFSHTLSLISLRGKNSCAAAAAILNYIGQWELVYTPLFNDGFTVWALSLSSKRWS